MREQAIQFAKQRAGPAMTCVQVHRHDGETTKKPGRLGHARVLANYPSGAGSGTVS